MAAYYNEHDEFAAAWLRNLIAAGVIAPGDVDERSIEDVVPVELAAYTQVHLFAGIGVWSYGWRRAGWTDDRAGWSCSCPCQPFSQAGEGKGFADERHLWPAAYHLVTQCRPSVITGEQVASPDGFAWLDLVQTDVEATDYTFGAIVAPSASVGAPHIRHRTYWVAYDNNARLERRSGAIGSEIGSYGQTAALRTTDSGSGQPRPVNAFWSSADWLRCRDNKWRPVEPGASPLVDGVANRVGLLRGYGNACNAAQVEEFTKIAMEYVP